MAVDNDLAVHADRVRVAATEERGACWAAELDHIVPAGVYSSAGIGLGEESRPVPRRDPRAQCSLFEPNASQRERIDRWSIDCGADLLPVVTHVSITKIIDQHKQHCASSRGRQPAAAASIVGQCVIVWSEQRMQRLSLH